ncbi:MAG: MFS transporter [Synergistales bacterium]
MSSRGIGKTVWAITWTYFFQASFARVYVLLPAYMAASGIVDPGRIGVLVGSFYISTFARPFVGWFMDRAGFRRVLVLSGALSAVAAAGMFLTDPTRLSLLIAWRILAGASFSFFGVGLTAYQSAAVEAEERGAGFSVVTAAAGLPYLLVVPLCELLVAHGHLKTYMFIPVLLGLATCIGGAMLPRVENPAQSLGADRGRAKSVLENSGVRSLLLSVALFCSVDACLLSFAGLGSEKGIPISGFLAASAVTSVLVRFFGRSLVDRLPRIKTAWVSGAVAAVFVALPALPFVSGGVGFSVCGALYGIFMGLGYPALLALIADVASPEERNRVTSLFWFFMGLAYMGIPVIIGYLAALLGYSNAFLLASLLLGPLVAVVGRRWERRGR